MKDFCSLLTGKDLKTDLQQLSVIPNFPQTSTEHAQCWDSICFDNCS